MKTSAQLIKKYNVPAPRYTSYPTVPHWDNGQFQLEQWKDQLIEAFEVSNQTEGISVYIHLPFCESLCTYCGCTKRITINHNVEEPYIKSLLKEWELYRDILPSVPRIRELHLGGGTPTFFSAKNLSILIKQLRKRAIIAPDAELSFEAHPGSCTIEKLRVLNELGFNRLSLGIQDFDPIVQKAIHRIQTVEEVAQVVQDARGIGYSSVNFDLIYGLPKQTLESVIDTVQKTLALRPERIAFYGYAHVPWVAKAQRGYSDADLPVGEERRKLYEVGKSMLLKAAYVEAGMDHFALPSDSLIKALKNKALHRNFMGYTPLHTTCMIGLGVSSISDCWTAFAQNTKSLKEYKQKLENGILPIEKGHVHSLEDLEIREHIMQLMCHYTTSWIGENRLLKEGMKRLKEMEIDGLVECTNSSIKITPKGYPFVRNVCMALDYRLWNNQSGSEVFSLAI